ncbi:hypothetical protein V6Z12_A11G149200, partial [Gossypium hirsutum]
MFDSLIKALDHPIGVVALGLFEVEAEEGSFLLISFNVNLVTGLGILCTNAIITLMNHLKVSLISQCKCIIISSRILLILLVYVLIVALIGVLCLLLVCKLIWSLLQAFNHVTNDLDGLREATPYTGHQDRDHIIGGAHS